MLCCAGLGWAGLGWAVLGWARLGTPTWRLRRLPLSARNAALRCAVLQSALQRVLSSEGSAHSCRGSCSSSYTCAANPPCSDLSASDPEWRVALLRYFNPVGAHPSGEAAWLCSC